MVPYNFPAADIQKRTEPISEDVSTPEIVASEKQENQHVISTPVKQKISSLAKLKSKIKLPSVKQVLKVVLLLVVAILSKMIGCGLGAKICKYTNLQSVKIGIGMISRGEVALIVATKGMSMGLMKDEFFAPLVLVVVATTIVTPILLKLAYKYQASREADVPMASSLVDKVEERNDLEKITQNAANMHEEMKEIHK